MKGGAIFEQKKYSFAFLLQKIYMFIVEILGDTDEEMHKWYITGISSLRDKYSYIVVSLSRLFPVNTQI